MIDAGVVALHVASEDELIFRQLAADVTHGGLGPALRLAVFPRHMVTASREIEPAVEDHRQRLQDEGVKGCPQLNALAIEPDAPQWLEPMLAVKQIVLELGLEFPPAAAQIPDIGACRRNRCGDCTARQRRYPAWRWRPLRRCSPPMLANLRPGRSE